MADHGFAHRRDGARDGGQEAVPADPDLVVPGVELLGDEVGVRELVAALPGRRLEADAERGEPALALLGQQRHDVARVEPAGEQHADRHVRDHPALDRGPQRLVDRLGPLLP